MVIDIPFQTTNSLSLAFILIIFNHILFIFLEILFLLLFQVVFIFENPLLIIPFINLNLEFDCCFNYIHFTID